MIQISLIELSLIPKYGGRQVLSDLRWKIVQNRSEISIYNVTILSEIQNGLGPLQKN